jgi:phenylalanyl-tRNA synthetase beta chain
MLISYNWLKELLPELKITPLELSELLTLHSFETVISNTIEIDEKVTVAEVVSIEPHPNADRLKLVTINNGTDAIRVVCGATNYALHDHAAYSPPGTKLKDEEGKTFILEKAKIRGEESPGMLNSLRELGIGEAHTGLFILPNDTVVGTSLAEYIPIDTILEPDIEPNRAHDCLSHLGVAREIAALLDIAVKEPDVLDLNTLKDLPDWQVNIESPDETPRYFGAVLSGAKVHNSPIWLQAKLLAVGIRPINNIVDITNFVALEVGNPTHTFDADKLQGKTIGVRRAKDKEKLTTLDDIKHSLSPDNLVITCNDTPVAVAGVMGGMESQVIIETKKIFLEVANFKPYIIYNSSVDLKTISESSTRFSKGISPELINLSSARVLKLLQEIAGVEIIGKIDVYPKKVKQHTITFNPTLATKLSGAEISTKEAKDILTRLRCVINDNGNIWQVKVPFSRLDLTAENDLAEEVIRVYGLEKIKAREPDKKTIKQSTLSEHTKWREAIKDILVVLGLAESYNYSFADESILKLLGEKQPTKDRLTIINPRSPEQKYLRQNIIPQLINNLLTNKAELRKKFTNTNRSFFEIGTVFRTGSGGVVDNVVEEEHIAGALASSTIPVKGIIENILEAFGIADAEFKSITPTSIWGDTSAEIIYSEEKLGTVGTLNTSSVVAAKLGLPISLFELNLNKLITYAENKPPVSKDNTSDKPAQYKAGSKYPPVYRDLSIIISSNVRNEEVQDIIERVGGKQVADVDLFDEYNNTSDSTSTDPQPRKSLAFHIAYQSSDKTMTSKEVNQLHNEIVSTLKSELSIELRE